MIKSIITSIIVIILFNSCEENFTPYEIGYDRYIVNAILNNDSSKQFISINKSYSDESGEELVYEYKNHLAGAKVVISNGDTANLFEEITIKRNNNNGDEIFVPIYSNDSLSIMPATDYNIEVLLPNGKRLRGKTKTPSQIEFKYKQNDTIIPPIDKDYISVSWTNPIINLYTSPVFTFVYFQRINGINVRKVKRVPVKYVIEGNKSIGVFPEPSYKTSINIEVNAFEKSLEEISEGYTLAERKNFTILAFILELRIYDENLTSYYASTVEIPENFTININEGEYSNIKNGFGVFGSYIKQLYSIKFKRSWIQKMGYTAGLTD